MATYQLITLDDIKAVKPISTNIDVTKKVNTFIIEAQDFDLKPLLGDEFYLELLTGLAASPQETRFIRLWNEYIYEVSSRSFINPGLKKVLIFYAWARYEANANVEQTAFGAVEKQNSPYSKAVDTKLLLQQVQQARSGAVAYQQDVLRYLAYKHVDYPLWRGGTVESQSNSGAKINAIGGSNKRVGSSYRCRICGRYSCNHGF